MTEMNATEATEKKSLNFIEQAVENDLREGKNGGKVQTRFPPEPNGYLHIGHAKAICLDFGIAARYGGVCNLRFDDTNPTKEDMEYVEAIKEDIQWLGFQWGNEYYASDYFQQLWDFAVNLIKEGKAYIDEQNSEQIAAQKGTPTQPGTESPYRNRPIEESLELFNKMNSGEIEEGKMVLRAKIDMASPNMHFRDPIIYRVVKTPHHRTGETWKAYPMYDFAHGQSDYFEGVTHSLCTLEFVPHRPLYDLFVDWVKEGKDLDDNRPHQYEFNKLNLNYTLMSKRNLLILVKEHLVNGWDADRKMLALVWRYLDAANPVQESPMCLCRKIVRWSGQPLNLGQMLTCLDIFRDVGLLTVQRQHKYVSIRLTPGEGKADLSRSQTMQRLLHAKES